MSANKNVEGEDNISAADDSDESDVTTETHGSRSDDVINVGHTFKYSNDTSDLRLLVEGKPLYVSRVILSLVSPVFKR